MRLHYPIVVGLLSVTSHFAFAQTGTNCTDAQRVLEQAIKGQPEKAVDVLTNALRGNLACAGPLTESAITASDASDELVAKLVSAAVRAAPDKAVIIAESAIAAAPSASDEVADVVQSVLGDCHSIAEDVTISIKKSSNRLLVILEDALRSHGNCSCEIVSAAVKAAGGSSSVIAQIVETSVTLKPTMAAEISECASAAAPKQLAAVQEGLDRALSDAGRGPGALPAAVETPAEEVRTPEADVTVGANPGEELPSEVSEPASGERSSDQAQTSYGKNTATGYGKGGKQGYGKAVDSVEEAPREDDWGWDWINWGSSLAGSSPVYLISPSGGVVPPGELVPLSPGDPKYDDKKKD